MAKRIDAQTKAEVVNYSRDGVMVYMIAEHFGISETSVRRIWKNYESGRFETRSIYQPNAKGITQVWYRVFDNHTLKMLGDCYPTRKLAEKALYGYL